jgi:N-acetylmuramoyl-L-alanine amidase
MRLYRHGDSGRPVRDIQDRLSALGYNPGDDARGEFDKGTFDAVCAFQKQRGLSPDGIVGPDTWRALWEASYRLGDRLLYLRRPMFRGDDVAELQRRLNALGFDSGKVDGIFGPDSRRAVNEFQDNRGMAEDGIAGPVFIAELQLVGRATNKTGRETVRERQWLRQLPGSLVGTRVYLDAGCRDEGEAGKSWETVSAAAFSLQERGGVPVLSRSADTTFPERVRARRANRLGAHLVLSFQLPYAEEHGVFFFASPHSRSEAGASVAAVIGRELDLPVDGRAPAILKETRAPAVLVRTGGLGAECGSRVIEAVERFFLEQDQLKNRR